METTAMDNDDWESQLRQMMSERDAEDVADKFQEVIDDFVPIGEPSIFVTIGMDDEELVTWLPEVVTFLKETELPEEVYEVLWRLADELADTYIKEDRIPPNRECAEAVKYLIQTEMEAEQAEEDNDDPE